LNAYKERIVFCLRWGSVSYRHG